MRFIIIILAFLLTVSCRERTGDFGAFSLKIPSSWQYIPQKGIDSYVGLIAIDSKDTLFFDYGPYSSNLISGTLDEMFEMDTIPMSSEEFENISSYHFSFQEGNLRDSVHLRSYIIERYKDTVIQNFPAIKVNPKIIGTGKTGIFVDSIWYTEPHDGIYRMTKSFCLVGHNLSEINHKALLKAIASLKFKEPKSR